MTDIIFVVYLIATAPDKSFIEIEGDAYNTFEACYMQAEADAKNLAKSNLFISVKPECRSFGIIVKKKKENKK
jgi:hypothetical protein